VVGSSFLNLKVDPGAAGVGTEASRPLRHTPRSPGPTHPGDRRHASAESAFVQSLPERYQRPLPPWDACFSGSIFMRYASGQLSSVSVWLVRLSLSLSPMANSSSLLLRIKLQSLIRLLRNSTRQGRQCDEFFRSSPCSVTPVAAF